MNDNEKGMDFGKPKLTRQDVMKILRISATTLWRWERDKNHSAIPSRPASPL